MQNTKKYYIILIIGGISFGTAAIFIKFSNLTPGTIALFRFLIAGLILSLGKINIKKIIKYAPFGFLLSTHMILFIYSVYKTTIIDATVLVSTSPFFAILLSPLGKFKTEKIDIIIAIIGFSGVVIMNYPIIPGYLIGNIIAIISAFTIALYTTLLSKQNTTENPIQLTSEIYISSSIFSLPLFLYQGIGQISQTSILALLGLIFIPTLIGHTSVIYSSGKVKPQYIETIGLLEPVVATILAIPIFRQIPNAQQIIGSILIILSILIITRQSK
ncbi:EamA family transporter [Acidianus sulfidivorans JP7]|uniref:Permease n=1 Tax=Acidianus sulfidivorans JP7 TaxID=619593 RepID=A0A2U9IPC8_9CREN|nr:DMT family transporter [Acidianus sulfidivorans]AWR97836.1 EamA family transporter [Acidianus sulfidivorans JP7]